MNCACMSVAKPGYSSVVTSAATSFFAAAHSQPAPPAASNLDSRFAQLGQHRGKMFRSTVGHLDVAAGDRPGDEKRSCLDAVGNDRCAGAPRRRSTPRTRKRGGARTLDLRAHLDQQINQVGDFRLARGIVQAGFALGQRRGHQDIFRAGHGDFFEDDVRAAQPAAARRLCLDVAVLGGNLGAHLLERLHVQIHGPRADGAASRQRNARVAQARHQRTQRQNRRAHGAHQFVGRFGIRNILRA